MAQQHMNELKYVEQELTELRTQLAEFFGVLDSLSQIQTQFEDLTQTYQQLKQYLNKFKSNPESAFEVEEKLNRRFQELESQFELRLKEIKNDLVQVQDKGQTGFSDITQLKEAFDRRCSQIENLTQSIWKEMREDILQTQNQADSSNRNLKDQFNQQISNLKREIEGMITAILQQLANQREQLQTPLAELEDKLNQLSDDGFNPENIRKLDSRSQRNKLSLNDMESEVKSLRVWLFISIAIAILSGPISLLLLQQFSTDPQTSPTPENTSSQRFSPTQLVDLPLISRYK
jgi:chromosome segregation ATPase